MTSFKDKIKLDSYSDEELEITPELQIKLDNLIKFFDKKPINYNNLETATKLGYPNNDAYMHIPGQHNTEKWLNAVKGIFTKEKDGINRVMAIRQITSGWNIMETYDFLNWLKFYESGDHMKYKFAQLWYENGAPGYFLHVKQDPPKAPEPSVDGNDIDFAKANISEEMTKSEKKQIIERQRNKIIGRLDSAEKLLRSPDGQVFSGNEFESLMESIYQLKKKIQLVNKISTSIKLYQDIIIRESNILYKNGFIKAANVLYSIAQTPAASAESAQGSNAPFVPVSSPPASPLVPSGSPGGLPSLGPGMPQPPGSPPSPPNDNSPSIESSEDNRPKGISEFLEGMETANLTVNDDIHGVDDLEVTDEDELLVTEAQISPKEEIPMTDTPAPAQLDPSPVAPPKIQNKTNVPATEMPLEVSEDDISNVNKEVKDVSEFDNKIDAMFSNTTVNDVIAKLEDLAKIFKVREVPRQLAIVDMMLDSLGLASFFPSLSEAQNKSLESNNYVSTRIEDILSKLRGSITTKEVDLKGEMSNSSPEVENIKKNLQEKDDKDKARKQMRKEQEAEELSNKPTPEVEMKEDLATPIETAPAPVPKA